MAQDEGLAQILRDALAGHPDIAERNMFGGPCFLLRGNMLCGVHRDGGMFRVGRKNETAALAIAGVSPMALTGRRMGGMVDARDDTPADDSRRRRLVSLAMDFVGPLPAK
ncbi:MAG: TfoX/Sxy family protein [Paracoccaceae bacterium]